jgi:hypothetical protein
VDPTDGLTFWASNEYMGTNFIYNTALGSFKVQRPQDLDYYSLAANAGDTLHATVNLPGSSTGAQFVNSLSPVIELFDPNGNLVASGTTSLTFTALISGTYTYLVTGATSTSQGEYVLDDPVTPAATPVNMAPAAPPPAQTVDSRVSPVVQDRGTSPTTSLAGPATTATPAANGLAPAGGQLARLGSADSVAAPAGFSTPPSPTGLAGAPAAMNTGAVTGLIAPAMSAWGTLPTATTDDTDAPVQGGLLLAPLGQGTNGEILYGDESVNPEGKGRPTPRSDSRVPADLPPETVPPPVEFLPPQASGTYLGSAPRTQSEADSSLTAPADSAASWNPAVFYGAVASLMLGGFFYQAEAAESFEEKRRRLRG